MTNKDRKSTLFGSRLSSIFNAYSDIDIQDKKSKSIKIEGSKKPPVDSTKSFSNATQTHLSPDYSQSPKQHSLNHCNSTDSSIFLTPMSSNTANTEQRKVQRKPPPDFDAEYKLKSPPDMPEGLKAPKMHPTNDLNTVHDSSLRDKIPQQFSELEKISSSNSETSHSPFLDEVENQNNSVLMSDINNLLFPEHTSSKPISEDGNSFSFMNDYTSRPETSDGEIHFPTNTTEIITDFDDSNSNLSYAKHNNGSTANSILAPYPIDSPISGTYNQDMTYDVFRTSTEQFNPITSPTGSRLTGTSSSKSSEIISSTQNIPYETKNHDILASLAPVDSASSLATSPTPSHGAILTPATSSTFQLFKSSNKPVNSFQGDFASSDLNEFIALNKSNSNSATHTKSKSISSVWGSSSLKNVNLATLKKHMDLKPGEGEPSSYVLAIRKNSGTAYNESGPGKWKLPTGILPIDKSAANNGKYMRLVGGMSQGRTKKASGVDLKHGHLQRRLLATEVDGSDDIMFGANTLLTGTSSSLHTAVKSSGSSSVVPFSRTSSLRKSITGSSSLNTNTESPSNISTRRESIISTSSSGSISDSNQKFGYYQHASYRYEEEYDGDNSLEMNEKLTLRTSNDYNEYPERGGGGFYLANPDSDDNES